MAQDIASYFKGQTHALVSMAWRLKGLYEFNKVIDSDAWELIRKEIIARAVDIDNDAELWHIDISALEDVQEILDEVIA